MSTPADSSSSIPWRWLPVALWMALIFDGSGDTLSAAHTSVLLEPFLRWLLGGNASPANVEWAHHLVRKAGHVGEYAVLATLLWQALRPSAPSPTLPATPPAAAAPRLGRAAWLAIGLAAVFAASDEFHQSFVPSRGASVADVCLDSAGATLGVLGLQAWRWLRRDRR